MRASAVIGTIALVLLAPAGLAAGEGTGGMVRIGDPGSVFDPERFDPAYPDSREWARAGVEGGVPFRKRTPVVARLEPGADIQAAIDRAAGSPGVVLLARGKHRITERLRLADQVILRGEDRDETVLSYDIGSDAGSGLGTCLLLRKVERAGVEDLTIQHARVAELDHDKYHRKYENHPGWESGDNATVEINKSTNCWVQHCKIIDNVNRPVRVWAGSSHITLRDNVVDYAVNRGGQGSSYYEIVHATYVLMYNEHVRRIRHVCLDGTIDYCVLAYCDFEVDVNWHCIPPMAKSLVTRCACRAREVGHRWPAFCHYRDPVPTSNLIYRVNPGYDDGRVYCTENPGKPFVKDSGRAPPTTGCLYPVTGRHIPYEVIARDKLLARLAQAERAGAWSVVLGCVHRLRATGDPADAAEGDRLAALQERAEAEAERVLTGLVEAEDAAGLRDFAATWEQAACRERAVAAAEALGERELADLRVRRRVVGEDWAAFIATWQGFAVAATAQQHYDGLAQVAVDEFRERYDEPGRTWLRAALRLLADWPASGPTAAVDAEVAEVLDPVLAEVLALNDDRQRVRRLHAFVESFGASSTGRRAAAALAAAE